MFSTPREPSAPGRRKLATNGPSTRYLRLRAAGPSPEESWWRGLIMARTIQGSDSRAARLDSFAHHARALTFTK
jgi:hypothetical protein